ncbi:MAG: hypothetical protein WC284_02160 [Candidimonas sp.]
MENSVGDGKQRDQSPWLTGALGSSFAALGGAVSAASGGGGGGIYNGPL